MRKEGVECIDFIMIILSFKKAQLKIQKTTNLRFLELGFLKKGQLKIQEMAFMLVAVFLFFILVGLFVIVIVYMNLYEKSTKVAEDRTLSAVSNLADYPEFACSFSKSNCIDGDKLINLIGTDVYRDFLPFSSLKVITSNGFGKSYDKMVRCNFANYPVCDIYIVYDKKVKNERSIASFVALCRKEYDINRDYTYERCELAKLVAGTQLKTVG